MIPFCPRDMSGNLLLSIRSKLINRSKVDKNNKHVGKNFQMRLSGFKRKRHELSKQIKQLTPHFLYQKKPYSAVTVAIEKFTSEDYEVDSSSGLPELVEAINLLPSSGPTEASRAIRKKLKYGNEHQQLRALVILDGLLQNAGKNFQTNFADGPLLDRLRFCGTAETSHALVRDKCKELFASWAKQYRGPGLTHIANLHKQLPRHKQTVTQNESKVLREIEQNPFEDDEEEDTPPAPVPASGHSRNTSLSQGQSSRSSLFSPSAPVTESKKAAKREKDKKKGKNTRKPFNLAAEKEAITNCIAESSLSSTNLMNALRLVNREKEQISENQNALRHFEQCKLNYRKIGYYIQRVESEVYLGSLIYANDQLITALITYEQLDRSIDADSDSDDEMAEQAHIYNKATADKGKDVSQSLAGLQIGASSPEQRPPPPPRPAQPPPPAANEEDDFESEDENDPFADRNALNTPRIEKDEPSWKVF